MQIAIYYNPTTLKFKKVQEINTKTNQITLQIPKIKKR